MLGKAQIDLKDLPALEGIEREIPISGGKGSVRLVLLFRPEFVTKNARMSSFAAGAKAGAKVAANVGSGAAQLASTSVRGVVTGGGVVGKAGVNAVGTAAGAAAGLVSGGAKFVLNKNEEKVKEEKVKGKSDENLEDKLRPNIDRQNSEKNEENGMSS